MFAFALWTLEPLNSPIHPYFGEKKERTLLFSAGVIYRKRWLEQFCSFRVCLDQYAFHTVHAGEKPTLGNSLLVWCGERWAGVECLLNSFCCGCSLVFVWGFLPTWAHFSLSTQQMGHLPIMRLQWRIIHSHSCCSTLGMFWSARVLSLRNRILCSLIVWLNETWRIKRKPIGEKGVN